MINLTWDWTDPNHKKSDFKNNLPSYEKEKVRDEWRRKRLSFVAKYLIGGLLYLLSFLVAFFSFFIYIDKGTDLWGAIFTVSFILSVLLFFWIVGNSE